MKQYRVWLGFDGEVYAGEDPRCPWEWKGSGCYDIFEQKTVFAIAEIWGNPDNFEDLLREYLDKEYMMDIWDIQIIEVAEIGEEEGDDPGEYVDDFREFKDRSGLIGREKLNISEFMRAWDPNREMMPGDLFKLSDGKTIEIL